MMVCVYDKNTQELLQTIESESFYFNDKKGISNSFSFTDYNFDRYNNISFFSLVNGTYGTHRSEYFAYNPKTNQFEYDDFFNDEIVSQSIGLEFDKVKKQIISHQKSGAAWYCSIVFKVKNGKYVESKRFINDYHTSLYPIFIQYKDKNGKTKEIIKNRINMEVSDLDESNNFVNKYYEIFEKTESY